MKFKKFYSPFCPANRCLILSLVFCVSCPHNLDLMPLYPTVLFTHIRFIDISRCVAAVLASKIVDYRTSLTNVSSLQSSELKRQLLRDSIPDPSTSYHSNSIRSLHHFVLDLILSTRRAIIDTQAECIQSSIRLIQHILQCYQENLWLTALP